MRKISVSLVIAMILSVVIFPVASNAAPTAPYIEDGSILNDFGSAGAKWAKFSDTFNTNQTNNGAISRVGDATNGYAIQFDMSKYANYGWGNDGIAKVKSTSAVLFNDANLKNTKPNIVIRFSYRYDNLSGGTSGNTSIYVGDYAGANTGITDFLVVGANGSSGGWINVTKVVQSSSITWANVGAETFNIRVVNSVAGAGRTGTVQFKNFSVTAMDPLDLSSDPTFTYGVWTQSGASLATGQVVANGGPNGESAYKITFNSSKAGANASINLNNTIDKISKTSDSNNPYYLVSFQYKVKMNQDVGTAVSFSLKDGYTSGTWKEYKFFDKLVYSFNSSDEWKTYTAVFGNGLNDVAGNNNWNTVGAEDTLFFTLMGQPSGDIYLANIKIKRISQAIYDSMYNKSLTSAQKVTDYNFSKSVQLKYNEPNFTSDSPMPTSEFKMQKLDNTYTTTVARGWTNDVIGGKYAVLFDLSKLSKSSKYRIYWDKTPFPLDGNHYYKLSYFYYTTNASSTKMQFINYANSLDYAIDDYNISGSNYGWQTRTAYFGKDLIDLYLKTGWQGATTTAFYFDILNNSATSDSTGTIAITDLQIEEISSLPTNDIINSSTKNSVVDFQIKKGNNNAASFSDGDSLNAYANISFMTTAADSQKKVAAIIAYYDINKKLVGIKTKESGATTIGGRANLSIATDPVNVTSNVKTIKAYAWNDFNSITPYIAVKSLSR